MNEKGTHLSQITDTEIRQIALFCDASDSGYGGHLTLCSKDEQQEFELYCIWNERESVQNSTWRELETVRRILNNSVYSVNNNSVEVNSDNQNVPHILKVGSKKKALQDITMSVHSLCEEKNIHLNCIWLPRAKNTKADTLSRMSDCDDWSIKQVVYEYFDEALGKHTCDRFASSYNNKCEVFNSKYDCAKTSGIDAFAQLWSNSVNWVVPPPRLIQKVVRKIEQEKRKCTVMYFNVLKYQNGNLPRFGLCWSRRVVLNGM